MADSGSPVSMFLSSMPRFRNWSRRSVMSSPVTVATFNGMFWRAAAFEHGIAAAHGIDAAGVGDHADAAILEIGEHARDQVDEIAGIAGLRIARPLLLQDGHGDLGQIIQREVVDGSAADLFDRGFERIAPEALAIRDPNHTMYFPACSKRPAILRRRAIEFTGSYAVKPRSKARLVRRARLPSRRPARFWRTPGCSP